MYNTFDEAVSQEFHGKAIRLQCIVVGKSIVPYHVPRKVKVECLEERHVCQYKEPVEVDILPSNEKVLEFLDVPSSQVPNKVKVVIGATCKKMSVEVLEVQSVERIYISPTTGKERTKRGGKSRATYIVGDTVEANNKYDLSGYTTVDPKTQEVTHIFTQAKKLQNDIESFRLTKELHRRLSKFCLDKSVKTPDEVFAVLDQIYTTYSLNITKIYDRFDLHLCVDLLFRSVLSFRFDKEFVHKGWLEAMIIGDTRCGKGYVAEKLANYFGLGEVVSGENATFAGLVGGLQQFNKHWVLTWGKIPMNDCGLLVIDETSGLTEDIWGKLSRIRSEGVAEITKIHSEVTNARTRLLFICNPLNKTISNYSYGIESIVELIRTPEDIARFDYVLVVAHDEVSGGAINRQRETIPLMFSNEDEQNLILWCWSRKPEEVKFTKEAVKEIYETANRLEEYYDFTIPLIQVENVRFKLAKIAIAFAARFYSNDEDGKYLVVKSLHVKCAETFFRVIYSKEASGYIAYSAMKKKIIGKLDEEKLTKLNVYFNSWKLQRKHLLACLLRTSDIVPEDIIVHLGCRKEDANECMSMLLKMGLLLKKGGRYVKTSEFTTYLKKAIGLQ
jgi:hypothetical protein